MLGCCTQPQQGNLCCTSQHLKSRTKLARLQFRQMNPLKQGCHCGQLTVTEHCSCGRKVHLHLQEPMTQASIFLPTADHNTNQALASSWLRNKALHGLAECYSILHAVVATHRAKRQDIEMMLNEVEPTTMVIIVHSGGYSGHTARCPLWMYRVMASLMANNTGADATS